MEEIHHLLNINNNNLFELEKKKGHIDEATEIMARIGQKLRDNVRSSMKKLATVQPSPSKISWYKMSKQKRTI